MDLIQGSGSVCIPSLRAVKAVLRSPSSLPHRSHQLSTTSFCGGEFACIEARRLASNLPLLAQSADTLAAPPPLTCKSTDTSRFQTCVRQPYSVPKFTWEHV